MSHPFEKLLKLQDIDAELDDARARLSNIEAGVPLRRHEGSLRQISARLDGLEEQLRQENRRAQREEAESGERRAERQRLERRLYGGEIGSVKEMEKMQARIADLGQQADEHELAALDALERIQDLEQKVVEFTQQKQAAEEALAERRAKVDRLAEKLQARVEALESRRPAVQDDITEELIQQYDFHRKRGGVVLVPVQSDRCGSCRVTLPVALVARVARRQSLEVCESCGRLLVWAGE